MNERQRLKNKFLENSNIKNYKIETIENDASFRTYDRITTFDKSYILMDAPPDKESVEKFIRVTKVFNNLTLSVPEIYHQDIDNGFLIIEDFENATLKNVILNKNQEYSEYPKEDKIYERAIDVLIHIHKNSNSISLPNYDKKIMIRESLLFIEWYLYVLNGEKINKEKEDKFVEIFSGLLEYLEILPKVIVHRDYHAENLFWLNNNSSLRKIGIIDFQDAVIGSPVYDIMSLLEDARISVPDNIVINCISRYLKEFPEYTRKNFMANYSILSLQRNLKIIGIFTKQATEHKNSKYLSMLPRVWRYVNYHLNHPLALPLKNWFNEILPSRVDSDMKIKSEGRKIHA